MSISSLKVLRIVLLVALVVVAVMLGVQAGLAQSKSRFDALYALVVATLMSGVCVVDSKILKRPMVFVAQTALFFLWPIAVPIYLIWARGWWGVLALAFASSVLLGTMVMSGVVAAIAMALGKRF